MENGNQKLEKKQGLIFLGILAITFLCACLIIFPLVKKEDSHNKLEEETENLVDVISKNTEEEITVTKATSSIERETETPTRSNTYRYRGTVKNTTTSAEQTKLCNDLISKGFKDYKEVGGSHYFRYLKKDDLGVVVDNYGKVSRVESFVKRKDLNKYDVTKALELYNDYYKMQKYKDYISTINKLLEYAYKDNNISKVSITFYKTVLSISIDDDEITYLAYPNGYNYGLTDDIDLYELEITFKDKNVQLKKDLVNYLKNTFMEKNKQFLKYYDYYDYQINNIDKFRLSQTLTPKNNPGYGVTIYFTDGTYYLGIAYADAVSLSESINIENSIYDATFKKEYEAILTKDFEYFSKKINKTISYSKYKDQIDKYIKNNDSLLTIRLADNIRLEISRSANIYLDNKIEYVVKYIID